MSKKVSLLGLGALLFAAGPTEAQAGSSLATPITGRQVHELWPIRVEAQIVAVGSGKTALPLDIVEVADGHHMRLASVVRTPRGMRRFDLSLVPRHHPESVELEWDLEVSDTPYVKIGVGEYLLHRLRMARDLELGQEALKIVRSDIVETHGEPFVHRFEVDEDVYEIRVNARSTRG